MFEVTKGQLAQGGNKRNGLAREGASRLRDNMREENPIRLINRKVGCANRLIEVFLDEVQGLSGETILDFMVVSPRQKSEHHVTGVAILPILDGKLGLLQIYRYPIGEYTWEVPRGFIDSGEKTQPAALRELEEETGLLCDPQDVIDLGTLLPEPGILAARTHLFAASKCRRDTVFKANELGHISLQFFQLEEFASMAQRAEIEEAHSLAVFYRYQQSQIIKS